MSKLDAIPWWAWVALAVLGLVLLVVAFFLWRRSNKKNTSGSAKKAGQTRLIALWREFLRNLPSASRDGPVVIVLGERLAGKTSLVRAATDPVGQAGLYLPSATEDPRLQFYAGKDRLVQELSGELLEDLRPETRRALTELWQPVALCSPTVLVVLNAASASFTTEGLRELGRLARGKIDRLTELRGSPPRVRVCVTHVDEKSSGFVVLAKAISEAGGEASLQGIRLTPETGTKPLSGYLGLGFKTRDTLELEAMERFLSSEGPLLVKALDPFFETLQTAQGSYAPPRTETILLAAMPEGRAPIVMGDAFALESEEAEREAKRLTRRRRTYGLVAFGVGTATLLSLYGVHLSKLSRTQEAIRALPAGADKAGESAVDLMSPVWPPLRLAYPKGKAAVREGFVGYVRRDVLLPLATPRDRSMRAYALSLYAASDGSDLGEQILEQKNLWAQKLGISTSLIDSYVRLSEETACDFKDLPSMQAGRTIGLEDWKRFASAVTAAAGESALFGEELDTLKSEAALLQISLEDSSEAEQLAARIDAVASACNLSSLRVEELFGRAESDPKVLAWAQANKKEAQAVLDLVEGAKADVPSAAGKALHEALVDLEKISSLPADAKDPLKLTIDDKAYVVDTNAWDRALATGRATTYARALVSDLGATRRSPLFAKDAYYPNTGAATIPGRGPTRTINGLYTKDAFEAEVIPSLEGLDKKLEERLVQPTERASLGSIARQGASDYGSAYRAALKSYYDSYSYKASSVSALRADVSDMSIVPSWFSDFLLAVGKNAGLGTTEDANLRIITDKLAEFGPIVTLMTEAKGKFPNLEKYTAILVAMLPSLDLGPPGSAAPRGTPLEKRLAPIGNLGMSVLTGDKSSPYTQVLAWLDDAAIPSAYRRPFLLPVEYASRFGLADIADAVEKGYRADILPEVRPVLDKFPFDEKAELDADPSNVEAVFGPKGTFSQAFEQDIAPVCVEGTKGEWSPMTSPFGPVKVPADALRLASFATRLQNALWDSSGKPQPIELSVKPLPMPRVGPEETVTLSYLRMGNTSIFGFNQTPAFQSLSVPWASSESAGVGLELTTTGGGSKRFLSSEEGATPWSFYRQLAKASPVKDGIASWVFGAGRKDATKYTISFAFPSDPGALFRSPLGSK